MGFIVKTKIVYFLFFTVLLSLINTSTAIGSCNNEDVASDEEEESCCTCNDVCSNGFFRLNNSNNSSIPCNGTKTNGTLDSCAVNFTCGRCDKECDACTGPQLENCTLCKHVTYNNTCLPACPEGYVPESKESGVGEDCIEDNNGEDTGHIPAIAGGAAGGLVFVIIVIVITVCLCRKRSRSSERNALETSSTKDDQNFVEEGLSGSMPGNDKEMTLDRQIRDGHDLVLRYTQDPTENIPQRPVPVVDSRESAMYENSRQAELIRQISKNPTPKAVVTQISQESEPELYENIEVPKKTRSNTNESEEIECLPLAPVPPAAGVKGTNIPGEVNSSRSTETEDNSYEALEETSLNSPKYISVKAGQSTSQPATGSKVPKTKSKKPVTKAKPSQGLRNRPAGTEGSKTPSLLKGPNYNSHGEINVKTDDTSNKKSSLMKGPNYNPSAGEPPGPKILPQTKSGLWRGPAYNAAVDTYQGMGNEPAQTSLEEDQTEDYSEMGTPETNRTAQSEASNSDGEDYINMPNETEPIYDNVARK